MTRDMCFPGRGTHINRDMCFAFKKKIARDMCFPGRGTHLSRDMCFSGRGTHIARDSDVFPKVGEHLSLGICVS